MCDVQISLFADDLLCRSLHFQRDLLGGCWNGSGSVDINKWCLVFLGFVMVFLCGCGVGVVGRGLHGRSYSVWVKGFRRWFLRCCYAVSRWWLLGC